MQTYLGDILHVIAQALLIPDIILLLAFIAYALFSIGSIISEHFTEHRHFKVTMPKFLAALMKANENDIPQVVGDSGLLKRQKKALLTVFDYRTLPGDALVALIKREVGEEEARYDRITARNNMAARVAPMLGLMGTLIPLGPGIQALGKADTAALSSSLLIAFDTTVAGLVVAAICLVIGKIRSTWYNDYMSALDSGMATMLEKIEQMRAQGKITVEEPTDYAFLYETEPSGFSLGKKGSVQESDSAAPKRELVKPEPSNQPKPKPASQTISQIAPELVATPRVQEQPEANHTPRSATAAATASAAAEIVAPLDAASSANAVQGRNAQPHKSAEPGKAQDQAANATVSHDAKAVPVRERALETPVETPAETLAETPAFEPAQQAKAQRSLQSELKAAAVEPESDASRTTDASAGTAVKEAASAHAGESLASQAVAFEATPLKPVAQDSLEETVRSAQAQRSNQTQGVRVDEPERAEQLQQARKSNTGLQEPVSNSPAASRSSWYQPRLHTEDAGRQAKGGWNPSGYYRRSENGQTAVNSQAASDVLAQNDKRKSSASGDEDLYSLDFTLE